MIPGEELPTPEFATVATAVLAGVAVPGEEEGIGHLAAEPAGYVDKANQADHERQRNLYVFRPERPSMIRLEDLGFLVQDQTHGPPGGNDGQGLKGSVER